MRTKMTLVFSCFFFSSRRRHTSYIGDWSSDVCSSDLGIWSRDVDIPLQRPTRYGDREFLTDEERAELDRRSEERRVGKEGRSRWSQKQQKKKQNRSGRLEHADTYEAGRRRQGRQERVL